MCVRGGICGNLLEGFTSVIQLARACFFFFSLLGEAVREEEYHLVSEYKWLDFAWEKKKMVGEVHRIMQASNNEQIGPLTIQHKVIAKVTRVGWWGWLVVENRS